MIRKLSIFLLLMSFVFPVYAQQAITFSSVKVDLWPEFDQPSMLVIYHLTLSPAVSLPAEVTLRIPAGAGEPHAVAVRQADGALFTVQYQRAVRDQWADINLTATTPDIQVEYYDPTLTKAGSQRSFVFKWPPDFDVENAVIDVQQPVGAANMEISPALGSGILGSDGLTYFSGDVTSRLSDPAFELKLSYDKQSDDLSMMDVQVQPSSPIDGTISGQSEPVQTYLPWIMGGLGVIFILGGVAWYWQSGRRQTGQSKRRERHKTNGSSEKPVLEETGQIYCQQCGNRAGVGDRFCRICGTRLRIEP